jgi:peptidoglycan/LPS O-acetylase OafA/YrhL
MFKLYGDTLKDQIRKYAAVITIFGGLLILPCAIWGYEKPLLYTAGLTALYMGWGMILAVAMCFDFKTENKIITTIALVGTFSYSIYLWHKPFSGLCSLPSDWWPFHLNAWGRLAVFFIASFVVGIGMSKLVEYPTLKLRDKWFPSRSA